MQYNDLGGGGRDIDPKQYSLEVQWSDEDQAFLACSPEWDERPLGHGDTLEEAIKEGEIMFRLMSEMFQQEGRSLPRPNSYLAA